MLNQYADTLAPKTSGLMKNQHIGRNTPAIKGQWLNDAGEVFSYLQRHEIEKDGWWRTLSTTLNLLKQARHMIEHSDNRIKAQEERILELERLTDTDELTQITNRRGFMRNFEREIDRVNRDKSQGGLLIMIDLDNFKTINDTHGHQAGDAALKLVATALKNDIRKMDIAGRLGGDEFVLLFANTNRKDALERAQKIIKLLNNLSFIWEGAEIPVRASLGLKEYKKNSRIERIFEAADQDMYAKKIDKKKKSTTT